MKKLILIYLTITITLVMFLTILHFQEKRYNKTLRFLNLVDMFADEWTNGHLSRYNNFLNIMEEADDYESNLKKWHDY